MMIETYFWLCLSALVAGAINAVAGGGTLLTFPALFAALGTSAGASVMANATSTVASCRCARRGLGFSPRARRLFAAGPCCWPRRAWRADSSARARCRLARIVQDGRSLADFYAALLFALQPWPGA